MRPLAIAGLILLGSFAAPAQEWHWEKLAPIPDSEGVAGAFAGISDGALLVAGGANFPDKKPWEGGKKVWHDLVYALDRPDGKWATIGKLPRPLAYGVFATHRGAIICAGGGDADRNYPDTFRLELKAGKLITTNLPALPIAIANACGTLVGETLYLAGGQERPDSTASLKRAFALNLAADKPQWREIAPFPGPGRILAIAADFDGAFYLVGGADLAAGPDGKPVRRYLTDAFRYDPAKGWSRIADLPHPVVAAPGPAPTTRTGPVLLGGDDGSQAGRPQQQHPGFPKTILHYDNSTDKWIQRGAFPAPLATTPLVRWNDAWIIPSGEVRPGVRSPEVWRMKTGND